MMSRHLMNCRGMRGPFRSIICCKERQSLTRFHRALFCTNEISVKSSMWMKPWNDFHLTFWYAFFGTIFVE